MMINPIFMPYCENCDMADLSLEGLHEELQYDGLCTSGVLAWNVKCSHEGACRRIARLVEKEKAVEEVKRMPTIEPEPKWIPCKERLPDKDGLYLVTYFSGHARWTGTDELLVDGTGKLYWKYANVVAWQPLPKPFREGGDYA